MIEPTNPEQARKLLQLRGSYDAAKAWLDGYNGNDDSEHFISRLSLISSADKAKELYDTYWLKGSIYKDQEKALNNGNQV